MRIAVIAALPGELKALVRGWSRAAAAGRGVHLWERSTGADTVVAVCAGMGAEAARRAFAAAEAGGRLDVVLSVGWAGALDATWVPRACGVMTEIVDARTGERFRLAEGERVLRLVTAARVVDAAEKVRLAKTYGAAMVDMEAAAVARLAEMRGTPMVCLKAISDGVGARLPDINPFIDAMGQMRMAAFLGYIALRPRYLLALMELGRNSTRAAGALAEAIERFLVHKDVVRTNRTGEV